MIKVLGKMEIVIEFMVRADGIYSTKKLLIRGVHMPFVMALDVSTALF